MIKFFLALFFTFLFFSCASSPKENTAETLPLESENIAEENQAQEIENSQEQNPELSKLLNKHLFERIVLLNPEKRGDARCIYL